MVWRNFRTLFADVTFLISVSYSPRPAEINATLSEWADMAPAQEMFDSDISNTTTTTSTSTLPSYVRQMARNLRIEIEICSLGDPSIFSKTEDGIRDSPPISLSPPHPPRPPPPGDQCLQRGASRAAGEEETQSLLLDSPLSFSGKTAARQEPCLPVCLPA